MLTAHQYEHFRENITHYNSALAFASRQTNWVPMVPGRPYMKIHGAVYHRLGGLRNDPNTAPIYSQLYLLDTDQATMQRSNTYNNVLLDKIIMKRLDILIRENNRYYNIYKQMNQVLEEQETSLGRSLPEMKMFITRNIQDDRVYNVPQGKIELKKMKYKYLVINKSLLRI